jgi:ATP-dependent Lon protease
VSIQIAQPGGPPQEVELGSALPKVLPVLPLKDSVPFPETLTPLAVGQERSIQLVNDVLSGDRMLVMVAAQNPELDTPGPDDLYRVGVAGVVARMLKVPDGSGSSSRAASVCGSRSSSGRSRTWSRASSRSRTS